MFIAKAFTTIYDPLWGSHVLCCFFYKHLKLSASLKLISYFYFVLLCEGYTYFSLLTFYFLPFTSYPLPLSSLLLILHPTSPSPGLSYRLTTKSLSKRKNQGSGIPGPHSMKVLVLIINYNCYPVSL